MTERDDRLVPVETTPETAGLNVSQRQTTGEFPGWAAGGWGVLGQQALFALFTLALFGLFVLIKQQVVQLDDERKAAMVANLLVVLCGESQAQPVINTGTLYH
jgi:hypothetical protein